MAKVASNIELSYVIIQQAILDILTLITAGQNSKLDELLKEVVPGSKR
jgi:hypothetical protein